MNTENIKKAAELKIECLKNSRDAAKAFEWLTAWKKLEEEEKTAYAYKVKEMLGED